MSNPGGGDAVAAAYMRKKLLEERRVAALNDEPKNEMGESLDAMQVRVVLRLTLFSPWCPSFSVGGGGGQTWNSCASSHPFPPESAGSLQEGFPETAVENRNRSSEVVCKDSKP